MNSAGIIGIIGITGPNYTGFQEVAFWVKEIAHQLAVMNERNVRLDQDERDRDKYRFDALMATMGGTVVPASEPDSTGHSI